MILEMAASAVLTFSPVSSRGYSETARFVMEQDEAARRGLQESHVLGLGGKRVFNELCNVAVECHDPNWDGYGARPISGATVRQAEKFLAALPLGTLPPSVGAEPDGHVTLEWYHSQRHTLSVSVSPEGNLHYAALLGPRKAYGTVPFFGEAPQVILSLIHEVSAL